VAALTYGDTDSAGQAAQRAGRAVHEHIRGADPVTGLRYAAGDPALLP
jgi:uncharacterized protein (DUF2236 family)